MEPRRPQVEQLASNININMILREFFQNEPSAYHDLNSDNSRPMLGKLRKTRLTLKQLNKIRRMNDLRKYEYEQKLKDIRVQYAPPAQPAI